MLDLRTLAGRVIRVGEDRIGTLTLFHASPKKISAGELWDTREFVKTTERQPVFMNPEQLGWLGPAITVQNHYRRWHDVEVIFERTRGTLAPDAPRRETCIYTTVSEADAEAWMGRGRDACYELRPSDGARILIANVAWADYAACVSSEEIAQGDWHLDGSSKEQEMERAAKRYWRGCEYSPPRPTSRWEALVEGQVEIVRCLSAGGK